MHDQKILVMCLYQILYSPHMQSIDTEKFLLLLIYMYNVLVIYILE